MPSFMLTVIILLLVALAYVLFVGLPRFEVKRRGSCVGVPEYIADADTIWMRHWGRRIKVRLAQIDAPETSHEDDDGQPFAHEATNALRDLIGRRRVRVEWHDFDPYGRVVGEVYLGDVHVNAWLVARGYAWAYPGYVREPRMHRLQARAQARGAGLWCNNNPVAPWDWRHRGGRTGSGFQADLRS